jgi:hypothetical protein
VKGQRTSKRIVLFAASLVVAMAAMAGTAFGHGSQEKAQTVCDLQDGLAAGAFTGKDVKEANTAIRYILDSLNPSYWDLSKPGGTVSTSCGTIFDSHVLKYRGSGQKVFDAEKKAVYALKHISCSNEIIWGADSGNEDGVIDHLWRVDLELVENSINWVDPSGPGSFTAPGPVYGGPLRGFRMGQSSGLKKLQDAKSFIPKARAIYDPDVMACAKAPDHALDAFKHGWEKSDDV